MKLFTSLFALTLVFSSSAWAYGSKSKTEARNSNGQTIAQIASENDQFSTLVTALKEANLVDTFAGEGSFTVFAPTDAAFERLPAGTLDQLLANPQALAEVLKAHVVDGKVMSTTAATLEEATSLNNKTLDLAYVGNTLYISGAKVTKADIEASNGVIHVIDNVIVPAGLKIGS